MRRRDREIKEQGEIAEILKGQRICHLAMCRNNMPYVIPMIYVYHDNCLFFHCAEVGEKLDILRENNRVCFEVERSFAEQIVENSGMPCDWGFAYESVIGFGTAAIIDDREEKLDVYDLLVSKLKPQGYAHSRELYIEKKIKGTFIIKVEIESMTGKRWDGMKPAIKRG